MPVGVVPHYRPWLLVRFALQPTFLLVECRGKQDGYNSGATLTEVPLRQTCLVIRCHSQICLLVQCNSIRHACWVLLSRYMSLKSASASGKKSGKLQIHQTYLQVRCGSHGYVKLISYQPGRHLEYIKFRVMHHWVITRMMSVTEKISKSAFCMQFPEVPSLRENFLIFL